MISRLLALALLVAPPAVAQTDDPEPSADETPDEAPDQAPSSERDEASSEEPPAGAEPATDEPPRAIDPALIGALIEASWAAKAEGDFETARAKLEEARVAGADQQRLALELAYLALAEGDIVTARDRWEQASRGADEAMATQALAELEGHPAPVEGAEAVEPPTEAERLLSIARTQAADEHHEDAHDTFALAVEAGADAQAVQLELGWMDKGRGKIYEGRRHFRLAKKGEDEDKAATARAELRYPPKLVWGDLYAEAFAWYRFYPTTSANLVPTIRLRVYLHPIPKLDLDFYAFVQASRDVASTSSGPTGVPLIYADNSVMLGVGVQFRFWKRRIGLFAQVGPAFKLVPQVGVSPVQLDFRAGAFFGVEGPVCRPEPEMKGARLTLDPCADVYADLIYVSRFDHNLLFYLRGRFGLGYLITGPVQWAPFVEGRLLADINGEYYNNLADAGIGHRWRLLKPFGLDFLFGIHAGSYFGRENRDSAPSPLQYAELRWQLATYVEF